MKTSSKSNYFYKKYENTQNNNFYIFAYFPLVKSNYDLEERRQLHLNKFNRIILPSSFKVVQGPNLQGPRIGILYSKNLNFKKLNYLYNLKALSFKLKDKWYSYNLLKELNTYKSPSILCLNTHNLIQDNLKRFYLTIKEKNNQKFYRGKQFIT